MKPFFTLVLLFVAVSFYAQTDESGMAKPVMVDNMVMLSDSAMACCTDCAGKPLFSIGGRYYFNPSDNTRNTLAANGFLLEQEAVEYFIRYGKLPKLFYFQQLGTLRAGNYASITGFGLKQDFSYDIIKHNTLIVRPYVELGAGYFKTNIAKNVNTNSISTVLNATVENYFLDNFVFSGDIGLNLGVKVKLDKATAHIMVNGGFVGNIPTEWKIAQSLAFRETYQIGSAYAGATIKVDIACCNVSKCCK